MWRVARLDDNAWRVVRLVRIDSRVISFILDKIYLELVRLHSYPHILE